MSKEIKIFVGERLLDLYDNVSIPLNFNISDVSEINKRAGSFSKTIKIPATANNNEILGFGNDLNARHRLEGEPLEGGALTQIVKETTRVESNGLTIFTGFIKPLGATINKDGCYSEYKVNVFADNNDWVSIVKDNKLKGLDWSSLDHVYDKTTIDAKESLGFGEEVLYPLINFGEFSFNNGLGVLVKDRVPSWNLRTIFRKVFTEQGYTIESDFVDSDFFKRLYVPVTGLFELSDAEVDAAKVNASRDSLPQVSGPSNGQFSPFLPIIPYVTNEFSNPPFSNTTGFYTVQNNVKTNFRLDIPVITVSGTSTVSSDVEITIHVTPISSGIPVKIASKTLHFNIQITTDDIFDFHMETGMFEFVTGDIIFVAYRLRNTANFGSFSTPRVQLLSIGDNKIRFSNEVSKEIVIGRTLQFKNFVDDVTQLEFVQSLTHLFNLYFLADVDLKKIYIEPRDDFYSDSTTAIDWTNKVDNNKNCDISYLGANLKKELSYNYKEDGNDEWVEHWEYVNNRTLAEHKEGVLNKFTSGTGDKTNKFFAPTIMDEDIKIGFVSTQIPKMWRSNPDGIEKSVWSLDFKTRLLYFDDVQTTNLGDKWFWEDAFRTDYPKFYSMDESKSDNTSLYFDDTAQGPGLFNRYYKNTHKLINFGKKVSLSVNLTDVDIINFDFRSIVHIEGVYYYVESIKDYDTTVKKTTKVELLTLVDLEPIPATTVTSLIPRNLFRDLFFRRGEVAMRSNRVGSVTGGYNNDNGDNSNVLNLGIETTTTNSNQTVIGRGTPNLLTLENDSPFMIVGETDKDEDGEFENSVLLQFDRCGNLLIGAGEIYTSCGNKVLFNNEVCNLQPIQKENVNS